MSPRFHQNTSVSGEPGQAQYCVSLAALHLPEENPESPVDLINPPPWTTTALPVLRVARVRAELTLTGDTDGSRALQRATFLFSESSLQGAGSDHRGVNQHLSSTDAKAAQKSWTHPGGSVSQAARIAGSDPNCGHRPAAR